MHPDKDAPVAADPKAAARKEKRRLQQLARRNQHRDLIDNVLVPAPAPPAKKLCNGRVRLRDEAGNILLNEHGKPTYRPCSRPPIKGLSVCIAHGGRLPTVRKKAQKQLLAMVPQSLNRLGELIDQNEHKPTALGALRTVLERAGDNAFGPLKKAVTADMRPVINIGIKVGGIALKPEIAVGVVPLLEPESVVSEAEVVGDDTAEPAE